MATARLYARVSTEEQAEKYGLSSQLSELRAYAERQGYDEIVEYTDTITGADDSRPGLNRLITEVQPGDVILIHHPDRLSRGGVVSQFMLEADLQRSGATVDYLLVPRGSQGEAEWTLQKTQLAAFAQYHRSKIKENTARGRKEKARQGKLPGGPPPYGYRMTDGRLVVDEATADTVRLAYRLYVDEQRSLFGITAELNRLGVPTVKGGAWRRSTVAGILAAPVYKGEHRYNRVKLTKIGGKCRKILRPQSEWIPIAVPPIVSPEVWQRAQEQLDRNKTMLRGRTPKRFYLLRGLVVCGLCGRKLVGDTMSGNRRVYRCSGRREGCKAKTLAADLAEAQIWNWTVTFVLDQRKLDTGFKKYQEQANIRDVEVRSEAEHLAKQLAEVERQEKRAMALYMKGDGLLDVVNDTLTALQAERRGLQERFSKAHERVITHEAANTRQEILEAYLQSICDKIAADLDDEGKRRTLVTLIEKIERCKDLSLDVYFACTVPALDRFFVPPSTNGSCPSRSMIPSPIT